ncbi:AraC family transcriptional regulator [Paenibacillus aurantius]|uniref:AraC family transcriptional regulator n=1 Tax=Paenibacillus aurantius TaxID=2918900 RepID=A0AA96RGG3_9BACL|nr:AraC family transcriptional regulator [Paenibacillus aurantius]WNQ12506.1 AraC family transcriptional regulator [Paenibacillus aurantius]
MYKDACRNASLVLNVEALTLPGNGVSFQVHYWGAQPAHYDNPVHRHSFFEVCYVLEGTGAYLDDGEWFELRPGTLFCSRPGIWHQIRSQEGLLLLFTAFEADSSPLSPEEKERFRKLGQTEKRVVHDAEESVSALIWRSLHLRAARAVPNDGLVRSLAYSLLASLPDLFLGKEAVPDIRLQAKKLPSVQLHQAKLFIMDNLSRPLHLEAVADYLHLSSRHLSRLFSEETGLTFTAYVNRERISRAVGLLKTTTHTIKEVAQFTGFETVHYFTRVFTAEMGIPPARFRREQLERGPDNG